MLRHDGMMEIALSFYKCLFYSYIMWFLQNNRVAVIVTQYTYAEKMSIVMEFSIKSHLTNILISCVFIERHHKQY